jgi:hypothetical protein
MPDKKSNLFLYLLFGWWIDLAAWLLRPNKGK